MFVSNDLLPFTYLLPMAAPHHRSLTALLFVALVLAGSISAMRSDLKGNNAALSDVSFGKLKGNPGECRSNNCYALVSEGIGEMSGLIKGNTYIKK